MLMGQWRLGFPWHPWKAPVTCFVWPHSQHLHHAPEVLDVGVEGCPVLLDEDQRWGGKPDSFLGPCVCSAIAQKMTISIILL